ncbi:transposase, partial [Acinetobacter baumannii]|uniref:transposase n=1 Tax=Acinetobacter baumannii TaxID=470 RepID=UPI00148F04D2
LHILLFFCVPDRNADTLTACILEHVRQGTTIITICWKGYCRLKKVGYIHYTINHSENFVHPNIHTQTIEGLWGIMKRFFKTKGSNRTKSTNSYLAEFAFKRVDSGTVFERIIVAIAAATREGKFGR